MKFTKNTSTIFVLLIIIFIESNADTPGHFVIVGPRYIRGNDFIAYLTYKSFNDDNGKHEQAKPFIVKLIGSKRYFKQQQFMLNSSQEIPITFQLQSEVPQNYTLIAGFQSSSLQAVDIFTIVDKYFVLIQTDKAVYKPNDDVNFRVIVLSDEKRPYQFKKCRIIITDSIGNKIYTKNAEKRPDSVHQGVLKLSETLALGNWTIKVIVDGKKEVMKKFEVTRYELPRFEVKIQMETHVLLIDNHIPVTVYAKYTFGEFVRGNASITASVYDLRYPEKLKKSFKRQIEIDQKLTLNLDMRNDLEMYDVISQHQVKINVEFEEMSTGKKAIAEALIEVDAKGEFQMQFIKSTRYIKPGFSYKLQVLVKNFDGTIESTKCIPVMLKIEYHFKKMTISSNNRTIITKENYLINGIANFNLEVPVRVAAITVVAKYIDAEQNITIVSHPSSSKEFIQATVTTPRAIVGQSVEVDIVTTAFVNGEPIYVVIIGRTGMVHNETYFMGNSKKLRFSFVVTKAMMPKVNIIVYYISSFESIICDSIKMEVDNEQWFDINLPSKLQPHDNAAINIKASPRSTVYLLGIDQRALLLGAGNRIDMETIQKSTKHLSGSESFENVKIHKNTSRYHDFDESNAFIVTNAFPEDLGVRSLYDSFNDDDDDWQYFEETPEVQEPEHSRVRKDFHETWIFEKLEMNGNEILTLNNIVPDGMTSWIISGFAIDHELGIALTPFKTLIVRQEFFIEPLLPYSIRIGEIVKIPVNIFNYISGSTQLLDVNVTLLNLESEFEIFTESINGTCTSSAFINDTKQLTIKPGSSGLVYFTLRPLIVGEISISVRATSSYGEDFVVKQLKVEYDGVVQHKNSDFMIDLRENSSFEYNWNLNLPKNILKDTFHLEVSVIGNIFGSKLFDAENLIDNSIRSSEKSLTQFMAITMSMKYLSSIQRLSEATKVSGEGELRKSLQSILQARNNGSFSVWNDDTKSGSIWLTAYILKSLISAAKFIEYDDILIKEALNFITENQCEDGSFKENGTITHPHIQGELPLTAHVAISILSASDYASNYVENIEKALEFIENNVDKLKNNFEYAIASYAFFISGHSSAERILNELEKAVLSSDELMHWENKIGIDFEEISINIETASYALLSSIKAHKTKEALSIMKWLIRQRNINGGFYSDTDTVIGLEALAVAAEAFYSSDTEMEMSITHGNDETANFSIHSETLQNLQHQTLISDGFKKNNDSYPLSIKATGKGTQFVQIHYKYNMKMMVTSNSFELDVKIIPSKNLHLTICTKHLPQINQRDHPIIVIIEVTLPSGYIVDDDYLNTLKNDGVKKFELHDRKSTLILYVNDIGADEICLDVGAIRLFDVNELKSVPVKVYDYYRRDHFALFYYNPINASNVNICN